MLNGRDQLNPTRRFPARGGCLDTFVISKASTQKEDQAVVAQACFFASSFSAVSHMGRGHQLVGVWPESPASAEIKTTKISSKESARFSAKICTSENFPLYGMCILPLFSSYTYITVFFCYQFEPIYGTPYHKTNLSSSLIHYWRNDNDARSSFHLPGSNQFFPKDLSLLKAPDNVSKVPVEIPIDSKYDHRFQENSATSILPSSHPRLSWCLTVVVAGHRVP